MIPEEARANLKRSPVAYGIWVLLLVLQAVQLVLAGLTGVVGGMLLLLVFPPLALLVFVGVAIHAVILWGIYAVRSWIAVLQWMGIGIQTFSFLLRPAAESGASNGTRGVGLVLSVAIALLYLFVLNATRPRNPTLPSEFEIPNLPKF